MLAILVTKIVNFSVHKLKPHVLESGSLCTLHFLVGSKVKLYLDRESSRFSDKYQKYKHFN
jgi:hypothetical protein